MKPLSFIASIKRTHYMALRLCGVLASAGGVLNPALDKGVATSPLTPSIRFPTASSGV
jgi:hypothetical protein